MTLRHAVFLFLCAAGMASSSGTAASDDRHPSPSAPGRTAQKAKRDQSVREQLNRLPPDQRRKVLAGLKKVWEDDEVKYARRRLKEAAEDYKRTMREAVEEIDPEVREAMHPLVDRFIRDGMPGRHREPEERLPRYWRALGIPPQSAEALTPEERKLVASARERVMNDDRVKEASARFRRSQDPPGRAAALGDLRRNARRVALEFEPRLGPILEKAGESTGTSSDR